MVTDGHSNVTAHVTIDVTVALPDLVIARKNQVLAIPIDVLLANDSDPNGGVLIPTAVTNVANGTVQFLPDRDLIIFTPTPDFVGDAGFDFTVKSGATTATARVTVRVLPIADNVAPTAIDRSFTTLEDRVVMFTESTLLGNDSDADGDTLRLIGVTNAVNGVATFDQLTGRTTFVPGAEFSGAAGFDYTITDGYTVTTGHVSIGVAFVNDRPNAASDSLSTPRDTKLTILASDLLANDSDPEGTAVNFVAPLEATNGTVVFDRASGRLVFTADRGFCRNRGL